MGHFTFDVSKETFRTQVLDAATPVLVEFTADWCPPCKMLAPIIDDIAHKYEGKLRVGLMDGDLYPEMLREYGVLGLPTMILFVGGQPVERIVGFKPRERIEAKLLPHLVTEA